MMLIMCVNREHLLPCLESIKLHGLALRLSQTKIALIIFSIPSLHIWCHRCIVSITTTTGQAV